MSQRYVLALWAVLALTVLVRLGYLLLVPENSAALPSPVDGVGYRKIAMNLISGHGFSLRPDNPTAWREPGYPAFLGIVYLLFGQSTLALGIVQALMQVLTVLGVWWLGRKMYGDRPGLLAALLSAVSPSLVRITGFLLSEALFIPLLVLAVFALVRAADAPAPRRLILAGVALGAAALVRELTLGMGMLLASAWWLTFRRTKPRVLASAAAVCLVMFLMVAPWLVRNYVTFGRLLPLHANVGKSLYLAFHPAFDPYSSVPTPYPLDFVAHLDTNDGAQALIFDDMLKRAGLKNMAEHPGLVLRRVMYNIVSVWSPMPETVGAALGSLPLYYALKTYHAAVLVLALVGVFAVSRVPWKWAVVVTAVGYPTASALLGTEHRYVVPAMPFLLLLVTGGLLAVWHRLCSARGRTAPAALGQASE